MLPYFIFSGLFYKNSITSYHNNANIDAAYCGRNMDITANSILSMKNYKNLFKVR